jgi:hypothetical protein
LMYSVCSRTSYYQIRQIYQQICEARSGLLDTVQPRRLIPIVLVGSQNDKFSYREVSESEGIILGRELGCPFVETTATSKTVAAIPFTMLADLHYNLEGERKPRITEVPERRKNSILGSGFKGATARIKKRLILKTAHTSAWSRNCRFWLAGEKGSGF